MVDFKGLDEIEPGTAIDDIKKSPLRDLQRALSFLAFPIGTIDGAIGPRTRNAWAEFKDDMGEGQPTVVSATAIAKLKEKTASLSELISEPLVNEQQVKTAIGSVCKEMAIGLKPQIAYVLATAEWETAHTFKPVKEAFWLNEAWRKSHLSYYPYYGRGYVQLTWKKNYQAYGDILGIDLVADPDLALDPNQALFVLVHGFKTGTFTGRKITDYINSNETNFLDARRCINGTDKKEEIAKLAEHYMDQI